MGYIRHHAIVVTSFDRIELDRLHREAVEIFGKQVSGIVEAGVNGYDSFFIGPDGSKEGWQPSVEGDKQREKFKQIIHGCAYEDGSNCIRFAELFYADDNGFSGIVEHN